MNLNYHKSRSLSNYRVIPKLARIGVPQTITVYPIGKSKSFDDNIEYNVYFIPMELYTEKCIGESIPWNCVNVYSNNGTLQFNYTFDEEQEWVILIIPNSENKKPSQSVEVHVYSLNDDLYYLNPYMGDLHSHSNGSDGKEDPAIVAANYRKSGFDFFALTDHHKWYPSAQMLGAYEGVPLGIKLFNGEEVHVPSGWIHIVNFGSKYSVCEMYEKNKAEITAQIEAEAARMKLPQKINAVEYTWRKWVTDEIRKSGGLSIVAHPYWIHKQTYHMSSAMLDYVFETGIYDAFELVGGQSVHENNIQNAFYQEQRAKGRNIPIVGSSDSHGTDPVSYFGLGRTVVFAKDMELSSICEAVKNGYSVAIEQQQREEERVYGTYRMVKYTRFLLDRYFPGHDELCIEEGMLMREYVLGNEDAKERLASLCERTEKYMKKMLRNEQ